MAWNTAALTRTNRMPKLDSLMLKRAKRVPQTIQEQREVIRAFAAAFGGRK